MVLTIKQTDENGATIFSTDNNTFFTHDSFVIKPKPRWSENKALQREGNFSHYGGSDDITMPIKIVLKGANRFTNLATVRTIESLQFYLDASDVASALSGKYVVQSVESINYDIKYSRIIISMTWRRYNN